MKIAVITNIVTGYYVTTICPKCEAKSDYTLNLTSVLDAMPKPDFSESIKRGDLEVYFKPIDYQSQNQINTLQFDQQRILQMIPNAEIPEEQKMQSLNTALLEITKITVKAIKDSIASIRTPQALVSDPAFIEEFLNNCDRQLFNQIRDFIINLKASSEMQPLKISCPECQNNYEQNITLDMSSFFGSAS
jgi:hypothetical protein